MAASCSHVLAAPIASHPRHRHVCSNWGAPCLLQPWRQHGTEHAHRAHTIAFVSAKAESLLQEAKRKYDSGDRMAALGDYEKALAEGSALSDWQRQAAIFGQMAVHASFGDVELAQMTLRDAVQAGLNFEEALIDPSLPEVNSSPQILIQLGRFNKQLLRQREMRAEDTAVSAAKARQAARKAGGSTTRVADDADLGRLLGPRDPTEPGIDASPAAIAKRVALVLLAGVALGTALFYAGLEYMFPKI